MCEGDPELVMEYAGSSVVIIRQIFSRILRFDHMSRSQSLFQVPHCFAKILWS